MTDHPIMCTLDPASLQARRDGLLSDLLRRAEAHEPLDAGHRLRFPAGGGTIPAIARVIEAERQCCRFLRFTLTVEPDGGPVILELTGPAGTREFIATLLEP